MPASITLNDKQHVSAGVTILDLDGQPFASLPAGVTLTFASSDPAVADFVVGPDGMNGDVTSGLVGTAVITATAEGLGTAPVTDQLAVAVVNSAPGSLNFNVGTATDES